MEWFCSQFEDCFVLLLGYSCYKFWCDILRYFLLFASIQTNLHLEATVLLKHEWHWNGHQALNGSGTLQIPHLRLRHWSHIVSYNNKSFWFRTDEFCGKKSAFLLVFFKVLKMVVMTKRFFFYKSVYLWSHSKKRKIFFGVICSF